MTNRAVIVGGGILGTQHAWQAISRGWQVTHLEREAAPRGASVRNFGLIWVSGRAAGDELRLALRARGLWDEVAADCPGTGFRAVGSLTVAAHDHELTALEAAAKVSDAAERGFAMLSGDEARRRSPPWRPEFAERSGANVTESWSRAGCWARSGSACSPRGATSGIPGGPCARSLPGRWSITPAPRMPATW